MQRLTDVPLINFQDASRRSQLVTVLLNGCICCCMLMKTAPPFTFAHSDSWADVTKETTVSVSSCSINSVTDDTNDAMAALMMSPPPAECHRKERSSGGGGRPGQGKGREKRQNQKTRQKRKET